MDNKKLLKFLYKDIAEIEELVTEKGAEGFDEFEIEFIQSRFKGAKQLIQILSEKENKQLNKIRPRPVAEALEEEQVLKPKRETVENTQPQAILSDVEKESLEELSNFEEELKDGEPGDEIVDEPKATESVVAEETQKEVVVTEVIEKPVVEKEVAEPVEVDEVVESQSSKDEVEPVVNETQKSGVELDEVENHDEANNRLGDSFSKGNSVNELLGSDDSDKLEYKISNSPVESIKTSIGINDRYQYIRELFEGNAETFSRAVGELDNLNSIQEAVTYLQQNYTWKKNDTSLKFVNLVKRRFPNG